MFEKRRGVLAVGAATLLLASIAAGAVGATYFYSSGIVSNESPQAQVAGMSDGEVLPAGPIELKGFAADDGVVKAVSVSVDGGPPVPVMPDSNGNFVDWTISLDLEPGSHTIEVETTDDLGKTNSTRMSVVVADLAMTMPEDRTVEATSPSGALFRYDLPVVHEGMRVLEGPDCSPASATRFPIGTTAVTCTASFANNNTVTDSFLVTVHDSTPPEIKAPGDVTVENSGVAYMQVLLGKPKVSDRVDEDPEVTNDAPANGFALGTTSVVWTATDDYGNTATAVQKVTVTEAVKVNSDGESASKSVTYSGGGGGGSGGGSTKDSKKQEKQEKDDRGESGGSNSGNEDESGGDNSSEEGGNDTNGNESDDGDGEESVMYTLTINSVDLSGSAIAGVSATVSSGGVTLQTGNTPLTFAGNSTYTVTVTDPDGVTFEQWDDGSTALARTVTLIQNATITARYSVDPVELPDTTAPSIQITSPDEDSVIDMPQDGLIMVEGTASDSESGIEVVEVRVDSGSYVAATPRATGDWSSWSVTLPITEGERRLVPRATDNAGNQAWNSIFITVTAEVPPPEDEGSGGGSIDNDELDDFGIEKIYPTKSGGNEWYVNMNDPDSDPMFRNLPSMTRQSDGSWQVNGGTRGQVRMEAWSPADEKWLNVEITMYAKIVGGSNELLQLYSRGGHHTSSNECLGSAYKARLYGDGEARWVKEVTHPAYTSNRGSVQATNEPLEDRWVGFKAVIYNFVDDGYTFVRMESYIDDDVTDSNGNLVIDNNWELASVVEDRGGWSTGNSGFDAACQPLDMHSTEQYRQRDEIMNLPGGTATQNIAAWRSDDLTWNWKYLTAREIVPPS